MLFLAFTSTSICKVIIMMHDMTHTKPICRAERLLNVKEL